MRHIDAWSVDEQEEHKRQKRDARGCTVERAEPKTVHELEAERRGDGRSERGGHTEKSHTLGESRFGNHIGGNRRRGGIGERKGRAMEHAEADGNRKHRHRHIPKGRGGKCQKPHDQHHAARSVIEPPTDKWTHNHGNKRKRRRAYASKCFGAAQALDIERKRREAHDVIDEHAEIHQGDKHQVARPELDRLVSTDRPTRGVNVYSNFGCHCFPFCS